MAQPPTMEQMRQRIAPEALHHAMAAAVVSRAAPITSVGGEYETSIQTLLAFLDLANSSPDTTAAMLTSLHEDDLMELQVLADTVDRLVDAYVRDRLQTIHGLFVAHAQLALSPSERARLQRAFYHYEFYCRCFPLDPRHPHERSVVHPRDQASWFVSRLRPWQVEELSCVYWFFVDRAGRVVEHMEDEVYQRAVRARRDAAPRDRLVPFTSWQDDYFVYRDPGKEDAFEYIAGLATLGITFMSDLIFGDPDASRDLVRARRGDDRAFLPEAIDCLIEAQGSPFGVSSAVAVSASSALTVLSGLYGPEVTNTEDARHPNLGYRMAAAAWQPRTYFELLSARPARRLQRLGYVFWDAARLRHEDIRPRIEWALTRPSSGDADDDDGEGVNASSSNGGVSGQSLSVERRLRDDSCLLIPASALESIKRDYGNIENPFDFVRFRGDHHNPL